MRPYSSETLEAFLQQYLGKESRMCDFNRCKVMIPTTVCDRFPPEVKFFRNYPCANSLLSHPYKHDPLPDLDAQNELVWKVARASGAAPTYFSQFESFVDGMQSIFVHSCLNFCSRWSHLQQSYFGPVDGVSKFEECQRNACEWKRELSSHHPI